MQVVKKPGISPILNEKINKKDFFSITDYTHFLFMKYRIAKELNDKIYNVKVNDDYFDYYAQCGMISKTYEDYNEIYGITFVMYKGLKGKWIAKYYDINCDYLFNPENYNELRYYLTNASFYYFETDEIYKDMESGHSPRVLFADDLTLMLGFVTFGDTKETVSNFYTSVHFLEFLRRQSRKEHDIYSYYQSLNLLDGGIAINYNTPVPLNSRVAEFMPNSYPTCMHYIYEFLNSPRRIRVHRNGHRIEFEGRALSPETFILMKGNIRVDGKEMFPVRGLLYLRW